MLKVVAKYGERDRATPTSTTLRLAKPSLAVRPSINGGFGQWEHPTQALLDLYTLWRTYGHIEGLKVCIASTDLDHARTGHSMAYGLARLGAEVTLASRGAPGLPDEVLAKIASLGASVSEEFDLEQDSFNELIYDDGPRLFARLQRPEGSRG